MHTAIIKDIKDCYGYFVFDVGVNVCVYNFGLFHNTDLKALILITSRIGYIRCVLTTYVNICTVFVYRGVGV